MRTHHPHPLLGFGVELPANREGRRRGALRWLGAGADAELLQGLGSGLGCAVFRGRVEALQSLALVLDRRAAIEVSRFGGMTGLADRDETDRKHEMCRRLEETRLRAFGQWRFSPPALIQIPG